MAKIRRFNRSAAALTIVAGLTLTITSMTPALGSAAVPQWKDEPGLPAPSVRDLPKGWVALFDKTGRCRYAVPPRWIVDDQGGDDAFAMAFDGSATVRQSWARSSSWSSYAINLESTLKPTAIRENSGRKLWIEYPAGWSGTHYYVAVPSAGGACATTIDMRMATSEEIKAAISQIARTVAAAE